MRCYFLLTFFINIRYILYKAVALVFVVGNQGCIHLLVNAAIVILFTRTLKSANSYIFFSCSVQL